MSRLLVLQSASDAQAATPWLARCLASVRDWAQGVGADYAFHGDAALALAPDWYRDKAGAKIPVVTDLVRLLLIEEALTGAYDAALWLDADFLLAAPDRFRPVDAPGGFAVGREVWVDADPKRPDRLKTWRGPHNACLMVRRGDADSMICGTFGQYSWHLNYIRQVLETGGLSPAGALSLIILDEGPLFIADTHVSEAVAAGARVMVGGTRSAVGNYYAPTVLVDVDHTMACMTEETFGPTIPVMRVENEDEAVRLANDSPYGLSATVWTRDHARARRIARRLDAGAVNINDVFSNLFATTLPHSGWKSSGIGARLGGANGLYKYCRVQAVTEPRIPVLARELTWYPYTSRRTAIAGRVPRRGHWEEGQRGCRCTPGW